MIDSRTAAMLQRVPVILAVTAGSYGLAVPAAGRSDRHAAQHHAGAGSRQAAAQPGRPAPQG
jgi:hypothetical protein